MTTATAVSVQNCGSDTAFRAAGKSLADLLTAVGVEKTADTGQIDWPTVTKPGVAGSAIGYEIRTIPSSVGGDIYMRLEWRASGSTVDAFVMRQTYGSGSDGAGTITGAYGTYITTEFNTGSMNKTAGAMCYASSWDGGFFLIGWPTDSSPTMPILVDRTCTAEGTIDTSGLLFVENQYSVNYNALQAKGYSTQLGVQADFLFFPARLNYPHSAMLPSAVADRKRAVSAVRHLTPAPRFHKNIVLAHALDAPLGATFDAVVCGETITYLSLGSVLDNLNGRKYSDTRDISAALCVRWE